MVTTAGSRPATLRPGLVPVAGERGRHGGRGQQRRRARRPARRRRPRAPPRTSTLGAAVRRRPPARCAPPPRRCAARAARRPRPGPCRRRRPRRNPEQRHGAVLGRRPRGIHREELAPEPGQPGQPEGRGEADDEREPQPRRHLAQGGAGGREVGAPPALLEPADDEEQQRGDDAVGDVGEQRRLQTGPGAGWRGRARRSPCGRPRSRRRAA